MDVKKTMSHLIKAGRDAMHLEQTLEGIGYKYTPYYDLYGEIAEAVYTLLDEHVDTFEESITHTVMHDIYTPDEVYAEELAAIMESQSELTLDIPETTRKVIAECAESRGVEFNTMVKVILSQWAMQREMSCLFGAK